MHILVDAARAGDTGPSGSQSSARLNELAFENEHELREFVRMNREPRSWFEAHDLHLPAIGRGNVLDEHTRRERGRPPRKILRVHACRGAGFEHGHSARALTVSPGAEDR